MRDEYSLNYGGNMIVTSKGYVSEDTEEIDILGRVLISFHNEVENNNLNTQTIFKNHTKLYSTQSIK